MRSLPAPRGNMNKKVVKNAAWIIGCRIVQAVFALVINILQARELAPEGFGQLTYAISICAFMLPIIRLGIEHVLVNELIRHPEEEGKIMGTSLLLSLITSVCCIGGVAIFVSLANPNEPVTLVVCVLYSLLLIAQSADLIQYWFQAKYLSKYTSLTVLGAYLVVTAYKIFLLVTHKSIYWFAVSVGGTQRNLWLASFRRYAAAFWGSASRHLHGEHCLSFKP